MSGKKRSRNGKVKDKDDKSQLLDEIIQLGGSKEDLELIKGLDNESSDEVQTQGKDIGKSDKTLKKELKEFVSGLGLGANALDDLDDEEVERQLVGNDAGSDSQVDDSSSQISDKEDLSEENEDDSAHSEDTSKDNNHTTRKNLDDENPKSSSEKGNGKKSVCLMTPQPHWYDTEIKILDPPSKPSTASAAKSKLEYAMNLLEQENERFLKDSTRISGSDRSFISTVLQSGTLNDKISAVTLLIQESPLHNLKTMKTLLGMAQKKGRNEAVQSVAALKDLMTGSVLPNRKLKYFHDQPIENLKVTDIHLMLWAFEDYLKKFYFNLLQIMETLSHDTLEFVRNHMVVYFYDLLKDKPEQEQNLLRLLVNKLGDNEKKVASKTVYQLQLLLTDHPNMKAIVIEDVEQLIMRPNVSERAQYYGIVTLNQIVLTKKDIAVANKLIEIYFCFFEKVLKKNDAQNPKENKENKEKSSKNSKSSKKNSEPELIVESEDARMIAAVLTGVNRAFPYSDVPSDDLEKHVNTLFKITHSGTFNTSIQALMLIFQVSSVKQSVSDRFYRTLYESLIDPRIITSSKQAMYLNLLHKSIKADTSSVRAKAFIKRLIQVCSLYQPPMICGTLYMISELRKTHPSIVAMINQPEDNEDDEVFKDVEDSDGEQPEISKDKKVQKTNEAQMGNSRQKYDGRKRDPQFSNAEQTCLWELTPFLHHFHPSVALFSERILNGEPIKEKLDLHLHTLSHFLDRFVYRNPKKRTTKGSSIMQPAAATSLSSTAANSVVVMSKTVMEPTVNSEEFWRKKIDRVPVDQVFFHKYFTAKKSKENQKKEKAERRKTGLDDDEFDSVPDLDGSEGGSDADEDQIWKAMVDSMPGGVEMDDSDDDDDLEDLDLSDDSELNLGDGENDDEIEEDSVENLDDMMAEDDDEDDIEEPSSYSGTQDQELSNDDMFSFIEDEDDIIPSDDSEDEAENRANGGKRAAKVKGDKKPSKKRKKASLPLFASADDYAHLLENAE